MNFELIILPESDIKDFKHSMQEAFQLGAEAGGVSCDEEILPESHIDSSLSEKGAIAYEALEDGKPVGGAIVVIDNETKHNHLDLLFVKHGVQSHGIGQKIWQKIEELHPDTVIWETCTPYFEKRNIHFYVNRCGFHIVEYFNKYHPDPNDPEIMSECGDDGFDGMLRFEKKMK